MKIFRSSPPSRVALCHLVSSVGSDCSFGRRGLGGFRRESFALAPTPGLPCANDFHRGGSYFNFHRRGWGGFRRKSFALAPLLGGLVPMIFVGGFRILVFIVVAVVASDEDLSL